MSVIIRGTTVVLGIIGHPIAHSLSPVMQNAVLAELGIDAVFVPFAVTQNDLPTAVAGLKALGVLGYNVTVPHKEAIVPLLDEVDETAKLIGAVNTVKLDQGRLHGFNTDAGGFLASLADDLAFDPAGAEIVIVGAGGAARAAVVALAQSSVKRIAIANRTLARAEELCAEFKEKFPLVDMNSHDLGLLMDRGRLANTDLLVNTSSMGLKGSSFPALAFPCPGKLKVYDMVYGSEPTSLVKLARSAGLEAVNGQGMLAAQGERAFRIWLGREPVPGMMQQILLQSCKS